MTHFKRKRIVRRWRAGRWTAETSRRANAARWAADRARRAEGEPERVRELEEIARRNLPKNKGDMKGVLQWTDAATGQVRRWVVRIGDRADRITAEAPGGGQRTKSHGWTWFTGRLRARLSGADLRGE